MVLAPVVVGCLYSLVSTLSPGILLGEYWPEPSVSPFSSGNTHPFNLLPAGLKDLYATRSLLSETCGFLPLSASVVHDCLRSVQEVREQYQSVFSGPCTARNTSRLNLLSLLAEVFGALVHAELIYIQHQAVWDGIVLLLRGQTYQACFNFELSEVEAPSDLWFEVMSSPVQEHAP